MGIKMVTDPLTLARACEAIWKVSVPKTQTQCFGLLSVTFSVPPQPQLPWSPVECPRGQSTTLQQNLVITLQLQD